MKRAGNLFPTVQARDTLREAFWRASRGKRHRPEVRRFAAHLDENLGRIADQLAAGTFPVGRYTQFVIRDPKERVITAPCLEERVVHHAVMAACEPHFERWLIPDTFACRTGKGRLRALARTDHFARRHTHFLKCDVRKYFDSIPHDRLLDLLSRRFKDRPLLELFGRIVRGFRGALGVGLPIGSLTSQHLANFYLGWFDRFVTERLRVAGYVRYMDDVAIWGEGTGALRDVLTRCEEYLADELGLRLKPCPYINRTRHGMDFLGCRVFPFRVVLNRASRVRFRRQLRQLAGYLEQGDLTADEYQQRATALVAFTTAGGAIRSGGGRSIGPNRVNRGGSWNNNPQNCRSANRNRNSPDDRNNTLGFRAAAPRGRCRRRTRPPSGSAPLMGVDKPHRVPPRSW